MADSKKSVGKKRRANVTEFRAHLPEFLKFVRNGNTVEIQNRNVTVARLVPVEDESLVKNRSQPGCGRGSVLYMGDVVSPAIPESDWNMLKD